MIVRGIVLGNQGIDPDLALVRLATPEDAAELRHHAGLPARIVTTTEEDPFGTGSTPPHMFCGAPIYTKDPGTGQFREIGAIDSIMVHHRQGPEITTMNDTYAVYARGPMEITGTFSSRRYR